MSWAVQLGSTYHPYAADVAALIEAAFQRGEDEALVVLRGEQYRVVFTPRMKQISQNDVSRQRNVRRTAPAASAPAASSESSVSPSAALSRKRERDDGSVIGNDTSNASKTAVIVFAPGAGGSTAKAMRDLQDTALRERGLNVIRCDDEPLGASEKRWVTMSAGSADNMAHVVGVVNRAAERYPGSTIFLGGASFGNRVIAEVLRTQRARLHDACNADAFICFGYPLHAIGKPEGADPRRAAHLLQLPASVRTLFVQGDEDEFLPRGLDSLSAVTAQMAGRVTVHSIPRGGHTVPSCKGGKAQQAHVNAGIVEAVAAFVGL